MKKNEKMKKKTKKCGKMMRKERKWKNWIRTQNPRRFPGFTVVVVTFFVKIIDDFHNFVSECVSFPRKINNPFWEWSFFQRKVAIFIGRETKTHILPTKMNEQKSLRSASNNEEYNHSTIILSGEAPFSQARSLHPTLVSWSMLSPSRRPNPIPAIPP